MGLSPEAFWALTVREFWIKHRAFSRAEDRQKSLTYLLAVMTTDYSASQKIRMERAINSLRRYPIKAWLVPGSL